MWSTSCQGTQLDAASANNVVRHNCDSTYGQSGSPMYTTNKIVRAILTGGNGHGLNWATQVKSIIKIYHYICGNQDINFSTLRIMLSSRHAMKARISISRHCLVMLASA